jgi:hypothetical protein
VDADEIYFPWSACVAQVSLPAYSQRQPFSAPMMESACLWGGLVRMMSLRQEAGNADGLGDILKDDGNCGGDLKSLMSALNAVC